MYLNTSVTGQNSLKRVVFICYINTNSELILNFGKKIRILN